MRNFLSLFIFLELITFVNADYSIREYINSVLNFKNSDSFNDECSVFNNSLNCTKLPRTDFIFFPFFIFNQKLEKFSNKSELNAATFYSYPVKSFKRENILNGFEQNITKIRFFNASLESIENNVFDDFPVLNTLETEYNLLTTIDENVFTKEMGSRLTTLLLRGNKLSNLSPESFKYFTKLEKLDLSDNFHVIPFKSPAYFPKSLANLKDLSLQNCNISSLNDNIFVNLRNLEKLNLYENPLTSIPKAINILPNLLHLYIGQTNISTLRHSEDVKNDNLQNIYLSFSENLTTVESCAFCNFPKLQSIDFESCKNLKSIHENAFGFISLQKPLNIKDFYIGGCNISTLPEKLLDWKNLKNLYIRDNVFICDCKMEWLLKDLMENKEKWNNVLQYFESVNNITCSYQNQMEKIPLINLNLSICK